MWKDKRCSFLWTYYPPFGLIKFLYGEYRLLSWNYRQDFKLSSWLLFSLLLLLLRNNWMDLILGLQHWFNFLFTFLDIVLPPRLQRSWLPAKTFSLSLRICCKETRLLTEKAPVTSVLEDGLTRRRIEGVKGDTNG